jgi:hypothetical protein
MGNTNKSGYELRTDLLGMAIGILSERDSRRFDNEHLKAPGIHRDPVVDTYTTEDVLEVAEKLLAFVNKK